MNITKLNTELDIARLKTLISNTERHIHYYKLRRDRYKELLKDKEEDLNATNEQTRKRMPSKKLPNAKKQRR